MKKLYIIFFTVLCCSLNAGEWIWGESFGGASMERLWEIATDTNSNILAAGEFEGTLIIRDQSYLGMGLTDTFLIKYNSQGMVQWCTTLVSETDNAGLGLGTDNIGNVYLGGYFTGTMYCQADSVVSNGMWDTFIAKFNPLGDLQWLRSFGGQFNDIIHGLAVSYSGQVFAAGWFADTIEFGDGVTLSSFGGSDMLLISLDTEGDLLWARQAGSIGVEYGYKVSCDDAGNSFITGSAGNGSYFDGLILNGMGMYVAAYDPSGNIRWLLPSVNAMVISISNQRQASGQQRGAVTGRLTGMGSIGDFSFDATGLDNQFYWAEFDATLGNWLDLQVHGGEDDDRGRDCDYSEDLYVLGTLSGNSSFMGMDYWSIGAEDIVFYGASTGFVSTGGINSEIPYAICKLPNGNIAIGGWHWGEFHAGSVYINSGSDFNQNAFIAVYSATTANQNQVQPPLQFSCYPNPFKHYLSISSDHRHEALNVYNLKGQRVQSLPISLSGTAVWDGRLSSGAEASPGVYILEQGGKSQKVVKIR